MLKFYCNFTFTVNYIRFEMLDVYVGLGFQAKFKIIGGETVYQSGVSQKCTVKLKII